MARESAVSSGLQNAGAAWCLSDEMKVQNCNVDIRCGMYGSISGASIK